MITREGEDGRLGDIQDALQVSIDSPLIELLKQKRYYEGSKEEWESFSKLKAGDMDADGDYDQKDQDIARGLNDSK